MTPPGAAATVGPLGVKLLCQVRLNTPGAAISASYTWISSVCARETTGNKAKKMKTVFSKIHLPRRIEYIPHPGHSAYTRPLRCTLQCKVYTLLATVLAMTRLP